MNKLLVKIILLLICLVSVSLCINTHATKATNQNITQIEQPQLSVELKSTAETVREYQIVKMKATIKNTGNIAVQNAKVNIPLPDKTEFVELNTGFYKEDIATKVIDIGTINPKESKEIYYYLRTIRTYLDIENATEQEIEEATTFPKTISNKINVSAENLTDPVYSNEYIINLQEGKISLELISSVPENDILKNGEEINYTINVINTYNGGDLNNTIVTIPLTKGIKFKSAVVKNDLTSETETTQGVTYDQTSNVVTVNLGTLEISKVISLSLEVEKFNGNISIMAKAKANGTEEHYSNITEYTLEIATLDIVSLTSTPKNVKETENITYSLKLINSGKSTIYNVSITDALPNELQLEKATYQYGGTEQVVNTINNGKVEINITMIQAGETIEIKLIAKAKLLPDKNNKQITNKMVINANGIDEFETNSVTNIIEYNKNAHDSEQPTDPNPPTQTTYKITGTAWIDSNKNGKRDDGEELLTNMKVMLVYASNNMIVQDSKTGENKITTTDRYGKYQFDNLTSAEYVVIFMYESGKYNITEYKKENVDEAINSDAKDIEIMLHGEKIKAGISDGLYIADSDITDVDIGIYEAEKFDFKLDMYINKITRTTPTSGTETFTYYQEQNTKIEVLKQNLEKSSIVIEYKIIVTNQGGVAGYVKNIVDYIPEGTIFNKELNEGWILESDGNAYNKSLENIIINPGESKEITLVLLKQITNDSLGLLSNSAEIYESYNEKGLKDIDSTPGNNEAGEDDISKADILLAIVTGNQIIYYVIIAITSVALIVFGIYEIKKRVLK